MKFLVSLGAISLLLITSANVQKEPAQAQERNTKPASTSSQKEETTPMMVSFADLKWTALPERPGMQFAILSGDPKAGAFTQMRKVPAGTDNALHSRRVQVNWHS